MTNTITVEFDPAEVQKLLRHASAASAHLPCMGDQFVAKYYVGGKVACTNDSPDLSRIDTSKIPAALFLVNDSFLMSNGTNPEQASLCVYKNDHMPSEMQNESDAYALGAEELPNVTKILVSDFAGIDAAQLVRIVFQDDSRKGVIVSLEMVNDANETPHIRIVSRRS